MRCYDNNAFSSFLMLFIEYKPVSVPPNKARLNMKSIFVFISILSNLFFTMVNMILSVSFHMALYFITALLSPHPDIEQNLLTIYNCSIPCPGFVHALLRFPFVCFPM